MTRTLCAGTAVALIALAAPAGQAQSVEEFYKGKTVSILMGTGPGASYDLYGRTIAEHICRATSPAIRPSSSSTCRAPAA